MTDGWILWIRGSALTTCDSEEAMCPSPPSQCRTSGARYFLQRKRRRRVRKICVCSSQCLNDDDLSATDPWAQRSRPEEACRFQSQTAWAAVALRCRLLLPAAGEEVTPVSEHTLLTKQSIRWYVTLYQCENLWSAILLLSIMNSRGKWIQKQGVCSCVWLYLPEPDDLFAVSCIVTIHCVPLPVLQVYLLHAAQHDLDHTHTSSNEIDAE